MAFQKGIIKFKGRIGDLTFYKTKNGYQAREKGGIEGSRIATDPAFQRTRENGAEFGRAGKATKLFRTTFRPLIQKGADGSMTNRLVKLMMKVIQADAINDRGMRQVLDAETEMLTGFEFNTNGQINNTLYMPYVGDIDRASGILKVTIPEFKSSEAIAAPAGTTHFKLKASAAMIDFENEVYEINNQEGVMLAYNNDIQPTFDLECTLTAAAVKPLLLVLGVDFYQRVNTKDYMLNNGTHNALALIKISGL